MRQPKKTKETAPKFAELAAHIAAILNHPDVPDVIYNGLGDAVNDLDHSPKYIDSAEHIEGRLKSAAMRAAEEQAA